MTIDLSHFTGTEKWFRHSLVSSVTYTEGVQYLAEQAGAYWLVDKIATNQLVPSIRAERFQSWRLTVNPDASATLEAEDGNGTVIYTEFIHFTDFPMPDITLWCVDRVILLPSEY